MTSDYLFIVNPTAGQGSGKLAIPDIERLAQEYLPNYSIIATESPGHAITLATQAAVEGCPNVIAVGGDGTANEVLNGLMEGWKQGYKDSKMGIIAVGRGNDFGFGFGINPGIDEGFTIIRKNQFRSMDVGLVSGGDFPQGRYFGNGVGIGFDAVVGFEAAKITYLHGFMNYVVAALRTIFLFFNAPTVRIEFDENVLTQPALMVSIMNGRRMGGGFMMAPDGIPDDGLLNICIAGQVSRIGILKLIPQFMKGTQASHPMIKNVVARKVHVSAMDGDLPAHADGETICTAGKELSIEVIHKPLQIIHG